MVSPLDLVLVCWGYVEVEAFHSKSMVALVVRVNLQAWLRYASVQNAGNLIDHISCCIPIRKKGNFFRGYFIIKIMSPMA